MRWFIGIVVLLFVALILDSGLLAWATYVLFGLLLLSRWLAGSWIRGLSATRTCRLARGVSQTTVATDAEDILTADLAVEQDDVVLVRVTIHNESWAPVPWILIEDLLPEQDLGAHSPHLRIKGKRSQISMIRGKGKTVLKYRIECARRGYYQIGPVMLENGDLWGLHRRFQLDTEPIYLLVYPKIVPLEGYEVASRRPIGDVRLTHKRDEDPTRIAGARLYQPGDPLHRVHWKSTARTGQLHSKILEPSTLTGATIVLDFHQGSYPSRSEPMRSELAVITALALANAVLATGEQAGFVTNGRDAADRLRLGEWKSGGTSRASAMTNVAMKEKSDRLLPITIETQRGALQLQRVRETLARVELTDGLTFAELLLETVSRLPRDATILAVLADVSKESALMLGNLRRRGFAITVILVMPTDVSLERSVGRLLAEGIRDVRPLAEEAQLPVLCQSHVQRLSAFP